MHVDSDDYLEPNTVLECVENALKFDADVVIFGTVSIGSMAAQSPAVTTTASP